MLRIFVVVPAFVILASCMSGGFASSGAIVPRANDVKFSREGAANGKAAGGLYASQGFGKDVSIKGFSNPDKANRPPICSMNLTGLVTGIAVDAEGYLIVPLIGKSNKVTVYKGPGMCGKQSYVMHDPYGSPVDAAAIDADRLTVVANLRDTNGPGSVSLCDSRQGCYSNLTNSALSRVVSVALAKNGDCWADGDSNSSSAVLVFFRRCRGSGQQTTGFTSGTYGGLNIDGAGNLVAIESGLADSGHSYLRVYKGCNPACELLGGPFSLRGVVEYGRLDKTSTHFVVADSHLEQLDIYKYSASGLTYLYSVNNRISNLQGAAFNPGSHE